MELGIVMPKEEGPAACEEALPQLADNTNTVTDYAFASSSLEEFEYITSKLVSPNRLIPHTRGPRSGGAFQFHGTRNLSVFNVRYGPRVAGELEPEPEDDRLAFVMAVQGNGQLNLKRKEYEFTRQAGIVMTSGPPRILQQGDDCEMAVMVLDRRKIAEHCAKLLGHDFERAIDFETSFRLDAPGGSSWLRLFEYATTELKHSDSLARTVPAAWQQLEQMMMTGLLLGHTHNFSDELLRPQPAAAPYYVKRAEAHMEAHFADPLSLADLAAVAGVSARSLQNGFRNFRGMTPMEALRLVRLRRAHAVLRVSDPGTTTTTEIALDAGFTHMGDFASHYRKFYGVAPSQTLSKIAFSKIAFSKTARH